MVNSNRVGARLFFLWAFALLELRFLFSWVLKGLKVTRSKPCQFSSCLLANYSEESILKFWQHIKTLDDWKRHGVVHNMSNDKLRKLIPVNIHRDGAEVFTDNEYFVWSWSSTFAEFGQTTKDVLMKKYPIAIVAESEMQNLSVSRFTFRILRALHRSS